MINKNILLRKLKKEFSKKWVGKKIIILDTCKSTNDEALFLAKNNSPHGTIVISLNQTSGRGRLGRTWMLENGSIALSIILRGKYDINKACRMSLLTASAVMSSLEYLNVNVKLKWPNDILISDNRAKYSKVAGILIELITYEKKIDSIIIGIGLNVKRNNDGFIKKFENIGFVNDYCHSICFEEMLFLLLNKLEKKLSIIDDVFFLHELSKLKNKCLTLGKKVLVGKNKNIILGVAIAINDNGSLKIRKNNGSIINVYSNNVYLML